MQLIAGTPSHQRRRRIFFIYFDRKNKIISMKIKNPPSEKEKKNICFFSSSYLTGRRTKLLIFLENLAPPRRKKNIFSSYFSRMKVEELFLVHPLDHQTPTKNKNISSLLILIKENEKNILKLFFYSKTKNCRLPSINEIILLLNKLQK